MADRPPQRWMFHFDDENRFIEGGNLFVRERDLDSPVVYLHCQRRDNAQCMARGTWINNTFTYTSLPDPVTGQYHFHLPDHDLERQYQFARSLHVAVTHCYTPVRNVYTRLQEQHNVAAAILVFQRMSSTMYRWRAAMQPPRVLAYRDVVATSLNNVWSPIFSRILTILDAVVVEPPSGSRALIFGDRFFLRRFPINDLYICNTVFAHPTLERTQNLVFLIGRLADGHAFVLTWTLMNGDDNELYTETIRVIQGMMPVNIRPPRIFCSPPVSQIFSTIFPTSEIIFTYDEIMRVLAKTAHALEGIDIDNDEHRQMFCNIVTCTFKPGHQIEDALRVVWIKMPLDLRIQFQPLIERNHVSSDTPTSESSSRVESWILAFFNSILEIADDQWVTLDRLTSQPPRPVNTRMLTINGCFSNMATMNRIWDLYDEGILTTSEFLQMGRQVQSTYLAELIMNRDFQSAIFVLPNQTYEINMAGRLHMPNRAELFEGIAGADENQIVRLAEEEQEDDVEMILEANHEHIVEDNEDEEMLGGHDLVERPQPEVRLVDGGEEEHLEILDAKIAGDGMQDQPVNGVVVQPDVAINQVVDNCNVDGDDMPENLDPGDKARAEDAPVIGAHFNALCLMCEIRLAEYISVECMCLVLCRVCRREVGQQPDENVPLNVDCPMCREPVQNFERIYIPHVENDEETYDFTCMVCTDAPMQMLCKPCNQLVMCIRCAVRWEQAQELVRRCPSCNLASTYHRLNIRERDEEL